MSQTLPLTLVTPVLDDIRDDLAAVDGGVGSAQTLLRQGLALDAAMALAITHEVLFTRLPARWWVLTLFEAARKDDAVGPLQALRDGLGEIEARLIAVEAATGTGELGANGQLSELRGVVAQAHQLVDCLVDGPLGQQIRLFSLEGLLG